MSLLGRELHAELLELWNKLLKTENISIDDNFFEKGGNSLLAMDLNMELERLTGLELPESLLLEAVNRARAGQATCGSGARPAVAGFRGAPRDFSARVAVLRRRQGRGSAASSPDLALRREFGPEQPVRDIPLP